MQDLHLSNAIIAIAGVLLIAGVAQLFHEAISLRRGKGGRIQTKLDLRTLSIKSTRVAAVMIAIGVLLIAAGPFAK